MSKEQQDEVRRQVRDYKEARELSLGESRRSLDETRRLLQVARLGQEGYDKLQAKKKQQEQDRAAGVPTFLQSRIRLDAGITQADLDYVDRQVALRLERGPVITDALDLLDPNREASTG